MSWPDSNNRLSTKCSSKLVENTMILVMKNVTTVKKESCIKQLEKVSFTVDRYQLIFAATA